MSSNTSSQATYNYLVPADGTTHAVFQRCVFAVAGSAAEDWQAFSTNNFRFRPQGAYIDNTNGTAPASLSIQGVPFVASMAAGYAGWVSFPSTANLVTIISGTGTVNVTYVDYPVLNSPAVDINGNTQGGLVTVENPVSNPVNGQIIIAGAGLSATNPLPANILATSATFVTGLATTAGATIIGTPPANSNLRRLILSMAENSTQAAAGGDLLTIALNGVTILKEAIYIGSTLSSSTLYQRDIDFSSIAFNTGATGTLTATLANALTAGALYVNAYFD